MPKMVGIPALAQPWALSGAKKNKQQEKDIISDKIPVSSKEKSAKYTNFNPQLWSYWRLLLVSVDTV